MVWDLRSLCNKADYAIIRYAINRIQLYLGMVSSYYVCSPHTPHITKAYITYVRPKLEYIISAWSPHLKRDAVYLCSIKSVQKNFTRKICICCIIPFSSDVDRLSKLNLKSLEYCRLEFDLILTYKICYH